MNAVAIVSLPPFSVLLSVYHRENPAFLDQALHSIWEAQTLQPDQIVLVEDGPLPAALRAVVQQWQQRLGQQLTTVPLTTNQGLSAALNAGLTQCRHELVARMDTDDLSEPERFAWQVEFMAAHPHIGVCSGQIAEWDETMQRQLSQRSLPTDHAQIHAFAQRRSPINHPCVMFRRSVVLKAGGYPRVYPEDYALWGQLLHAGVQFANLPQTLLKMRVGNALAQRRGLAFLRGEITVFRMFAAMGFISRRQLYVNIASRAVLRLSPLWLKQFFYRRFRS